ncbi:TRAP transporter substrate-binding protein DctP [Treponema parvum]|uniref:TRAP transporter substrate-binding protein DctP n=1 Tax=Treponema parvum TaxID=138851 RepID=UPI001AEC3522|nr:TRAP transporter substrate-binding protein DctP [Treponema parvum]QTQ17263.1 TRAP transporter substrate-binding protein DctP [Treponema parvum]
MQKLFFYMIFVFTLTGFISCKKETVENGKQIVLRFSEPMPSEHPSAAASSYFADIVKQRSGQRINIKIYFNGQLGTQEEVLDQIQFAGIDIGRVNISFLLEKVQSFSLKFQELMYASPKEIASYFQENQTFLTFECQTEKLIPLGTLHPDLRCFYSDSTLIPSVSELKKKRIGIFENRVLISAIKKLEAVPVNIISADIYGSLINGYMDAREAALCDFLIGDEYPFINYVLITPYISLPDLFIMSAEVFSDFSSTDKDLLIKCAEDAGKYYVYRQKQFLENKLPALEKEKTVYEDFIK